MRSRRGEHQPAIDFARPAHRDAYNRAFNFWMDDDGGDIRTAVHELRTELVTSYVEPFEAVGIAFRALLDVKELKNFDQPLT